MTEPPEFPIDLKAFSKDPYPFYARLRSEAPIAFVPDLDAYLFTRREEITVYEKRVDLLSSEQPGGLMNQLMGLNMMRKDGEAHLSERKGIFPTISPKTTRDIWTDAFRSQAQTLLNEIKSQKEGDLMQIFAAPIAGEALKIITGLSQVSAQDMDRWSQAMIDGIANYKGDKEIEAICKEAVVEINDAIKNAPTSDSPTLINTQTAAGFAPDTISANVRLAISGGQNETRDAISGLTYALLSHPEQHDLIRKGEKTYAQAFDEFVRWMAPIGMSPRRIARDFEINGLTLPKDGRAFLMFASANRDEKTFSNPDHFDLTQDASRHIAFGAGPHFCAGAAISKAIVADVALPLLFAEHPNLQLAQDVTFQGWAFRGPDALLCRW